MAQKCQICARKPPFWKIFRGNTKILAPSHNHFWWKFEDVLSKFHAIFAVSAPNLLLLTHDGTATATISNWRCFFQAADVKAKLSQPRHCRIMTAQVGADCGQTCLVGPAVSAHQMWHS